MSRGFKSDGIGNYIHYSYENYRKYGIGYKGTGEDNGGNAQALRAYNEQRDQLLSKIKDQNIDVTQLEQMLQERYKSFYKQTDSSNQMWSRFKKLTEQVFQEKFINWDFSSTGGVQSKGQPAKKDTSISRRKLENLYKMLKNAVDLFEKKGGDKSDIIKMKNAMDQCNLAIQEIKSRSKSDLARFSATKATGDMSNFFQNIREAFEIASFPPNQAIGAAAEYFYSAIGLTLDNKIDKLTDKEIKELIRKNVVGSNLTGGGITSNVSVSMIDKSGVNKQNFLGSNAQYYLTDDMLVQHNMVDQKADILITYQEKTLPISVKNYMDTSRITLSSSSSLMTYLMGENSNFVNHYLNLTVSKGNKGASQAVQNYMDGIIAIKAMSGININSSGNAEYLLVQDRKVGRVRILSVKDIAKQILDYNNFDAIHVGGGNYPPDESLNSWVNGQYSQTLAFQRISGLLAKLHAIKLKVTINMNKI